MALPPPSPESTCLITVRGLDSAERVVVPGAINEVGALVGRHAPRGLFLRAASRFYPVGRE